MERLVFAKTINAAAYAKVAHLFTAPGRKCSKEEFESLDSLDADPNGTLVCIADDDFPLMLNNKAEYAFAKLLASTGTVRSIRGQNFILPYVKPWASNPSPYYPDFIVHLHDGRIAFIELKSSLGMCQDETIVKYTYLMDYCKKHGYLYAMIDTDYILFEEYLWPFPEDDITSYFKQCLEGLGGFNTNHLNALLEKHPKKKHREIRMKISSLVLRDPFIMNRYCHDDPRLINAVKLDQKLSYKCFG